MTLPEEFTRQTRQSMGEALFARLMEGLQQEPPVSIRVNERKLAATEPIGAERVAWCPTGYYLDRRPAFTFDPLLHAGAYYVQEASSMFVDHIVRHILSTSPPNDQTTKRPNDHLPTALDLCAAPGGKSTCLRAALSDDWLLYSNDPVRQRAQVLNENILKWGHPAVVVTNNYARDYQRSGLQFDLILADVPCSGEGMFRKDPQAVSEWSMQKVEECRQLQREVVSDIWPCLKPGGILVYSTCTFNIHENEENVVWIARELGAEFVEIPTDLQWGITGSLTEDIPVYRFLPGLTRGEGLFMAVLRKTGSPDTEACGRGQGLRILSHGPLEPCQKGKDLIPDVSEALSINAQHLTTPHYIVNKYTRVDVDWQQAIQYLRKEAVTLPADTPRGIVMITFSGMPLGFAKNIGNRANNLYPQEWKIKTTHIPSNYEAIFRPA